MIQHKALASDILVGVSTLASVAAWQEQIDWSLRILGSLVAIAAGLYSIYLHRQRIKRSARP